jgi:hypothetical protein
LKTVLGKDKVDLKRQNSVEDLTKIDSLSKLKVKNKVKELQQDDDAFENEYDDDEAEEDDEYGDYSPSKTGYNEDFDFDYEEDEDIEHAGENKIDQLSIDDDVIDYIIDSDKVHASINQYKLKFLGSVRGMNDFRDFLKDTANGDRFIKFWLDCEFYRDSMQDYDQIENMATRNRLFRDINEKYIFAFSSKVHDKIKANYSDQYGLNHQVFERIQYDILRRVRSYWVPRFILNRLRNSGKSYGTYPLPPLTPEYSRQSTYNTVPSTVKPAMGQRPKPIDKNSVLTEGQRKLVDLRHFMLQLKLFFLPLESCTIKLNKHYMSIKKLVDHFFDLFQCL